MGERPGNHGSGYNLFSKIDQFNDDQEKLKWKGTFEEYVDMVVENPTLVKTAGQTVYNALTSKENFFKTGRNTLFGAEEATERFLDVLKAGAEGLELGKRIILFVGPPGSGKSTLVNGTKRGIEAYSKTDEGALYAIADCPMHEDPMHLIPEDMRDDFEEDTGIRIDGDLCPHCAQAHADTPLGTVPVERLILSEKKRIGIGTFKPSDPKSQDITELVGSVNYATIGEHGTAADARAYSFTGELNVANRGVMEFVEMLKSDEKFLYSLLDLAQDRVIKAPNFGNISADEVILAHTNMTEYHRYVSDPRNEALRDRMFVIQVPYALKVSDERQIHEKLIGQSEQVRKANVHINPHALDAAATFSVLSRLKDSKKMSKLQKLKIYDGQSTEEVSEKDVTEARKETPNEGMSGISPRYIIDSLSMALTKQGAEKKCLTPVDTLRALKENLDHHAHTRDMKPEDREALELDITTAREEYDETAKREVQKAFIYSYESQARTLAENYVDNVQAFCLGEKITDQITGEEFDPDEKLMRSIEEQVKVSENGKKEFRQQLMMKIAAAQRKESGPFNYTSYPQLKKAIETKLFADMKDMVKITTSSHAPSEEQRERIQNVQQTLVAEHGYCDHCASELIRYVGNLLARA